jgi:hypothetical protein
MDNITNWRKASYSGNGGEACVEVGAADAVYVRDTTYRGGFTLIVSDASWTEFLSTLR